ncbi:MAG TPA: chitobiase/beta-hexosaminidase C-terminal domain-containing protein, partial [Pirellulales bacterium]
MKSGRSYGLALGKGEGGALKRSNWNYLKYIAPKTAAGPARTTRHWRSFHFETLETRCVLAASVVISEFMASNAHGIFDQDGAHADWIELQNTSSAAVNLSGWYLTDDAGNPTKWQFPSTTIAAGGFLTVFASGKDRHVSGQKLATNFQLNVGGGYLALETPDQSSASSFAPYPAQLDDVSYGITATSSTTEMLVDEEAPVKVLVPPTTSPLSSTWTNIGFDDSSWLAGQIGVGYDTAPTATNDYRPFINTDVGSLMNVSPQRNAAFLRLPFSLANKDQLTSLTLQLRYDDGFVAYLNGTEVARANFTGTPGPGSSASAAHTDSQAQVYQTFNITASLGSLVNGSNVLSIAGLNQSGNLSDFLIDPLLSEIRSNPPTVGYMSTPTPGAANSTGSLGFVADTHFSVDRGFYSAPFDVAITTATAGAQIRYTLDGSAPTATTGLVYPGPIHITTTTNLRAAAFKAGYTPTDVDTETYVFLDDVIHQTGAG